MALAAAFLVDARWVVPVLAAILTAAYLGGPRWNVFSYLYRALRIPAGEPEPAAPPRFSQGLGALFLWIGTAGLFAAEPETTPWWVVGWGPAVAVSVLATLAAAANF